jgi:hypothetical protein
MKECNKYERLFEKALYNELTKTEENIFNEHLNSCSECKEKFRDLQETINTIKKYQRPEPEEKFMNSFWEILEPKLEVKENPLKNFWLSFIELFRFDPKFKYQLAGGLALLVIGFVIGKFIMTDNGIQNRGITSNKYKTELNQTAANVEAAKYIERSKILLLGIMNFDPTKDDAETINLPHIQTISKRLAKQAPALKVDLKEPSQQQVKQLVSDLQLIMLQIANLEAKNDVDGIELVKEGVNSQNIFLKINIQQLLESNKQFHKPGVQAGKGNTNI